VVDLSRVRAVLAAFLPGPYGGRAVAETLFGLVNPSARLPLTYPSASGLIPAVYYHTHAQSASYKPQWPFGAGLSYTTFAYSKLRLSAKEVDPDLDKRNSQLTLLSVEVDVRNTGEVAGTEIVLLYLSDLYRVVSPEVRRLRRFERVQLEAGEPRTLRFDLVRADVEFIGVALDTRTEAGTFVVEVGGHTAQFELMEGIDDVFGTWKRHADTDVAWLARCTHCPTARVRH
jgi:beta-glucosidase